MKFTSAQIALGLVYILGGGALLAGAWRAAKARVNAAIDAAFPMRQCNRLGCRKDTGSPYVAHCSGQCASADADMVALGAMTRHWAPERDLPMGMGHAPKPHLARRMR